jgi:ribosomal protein S6
LKEVVEKGGGRWINGDKWEERRLCYVIKKKKRGLYVLSHFACSPAVVARVDRQARLSELVMRHLFTQDQDGLSIVPPARIPDDSREIGGFGGGFGGEKRFGGGRQGGQGGRRFFGNRDRGERRERRRGGDEGGRE